MQDFSVKTPEEKSNDIENILFSSILNLELDSKIVAFASLIIQDKGEDFTIGQFLSLNRFSLLQIASIGEGKLYLFDEIKDILVKHKLVNPNCLVNNAGQLESNDLLLKLIGIGMATKVNSFLSLIIDHHGQDYTIADFFNMDELSLQGVARIGRGKLYLLDKIKKTILQNNLVCQDSLEQSQVRWPDIELLQDLQLNISLLNTNETTLFNKALRQLNITMNELTLDRLIFDYEPKGRTHGESIAAIFDSLRSKILKALKQHINDENSFIMESFVSGKLLRYCEPLDIPIKELDKQLSDDLTRYINVLDEQEKTILLSRMALDGHPFKTLAEIGNQHNPKITRERVRQIEHSILTRLPYSLTYIPNTIWSNTREALIPDTKSIFPNLATRFVDGKYFLNFLSIISETKLSELQSIIKPKYNLKDIELAFVANKAPIATDYMLEYIQDNYGYTDQQAMNVLLQMDKNKKIVLSDHGISPHFLSSKIAMAQAALFYPDGTEYRNLYKYINKHLLRGKIIPAERLDHKIDSAVASGYIYQSGHGEYRHTKYLDLNADIINDALTIIKNKLIAAKEQGFESLNLNSSIYATENIAVKYFTFRYIARDLGIQEGIYFNGKSGADTVSLQEKFKLQGQAEAIVRIFEEKPQVRTADDIKEMLRSKSLNHAGDLIDKLLKQHKLVRVGFAKYDLPKIAFKEVPVQAIISRIDRILKKANKPVEVNYIVQDCNARFHIEYSKPWYISFLKYHSHVHNKNWHFNSHNLFSATEIPDISIRGIIQENFNAKFTNADYINLVQEHILVRKKQITTIANRVKFKRNGVTAELHTQAKDNVAN